MRADNCSSIAELAFTFAFIVTSAFTCAFTFALHLANPVPQQFQLRPIVDGSHLSELLLQL